MRTLAQDAGPTEGPWQTREGGKGGSTHDSESGGEGSPKRDGERKDGEKKEDPLQLIRREIAVMKKLE